MYPRPGDDAVNDNDADLDVNDAAGSLAIGSSSDTAML